MGRENFVCALCAGTTIDPLRMPCGHSFCRSHLGYLTGSSGGRACPACDKRTVAQGYGVAAAATSKRCGLCQHSLGDESYTIMPCAHSVCFRCWGSFEKKPAMCPCCAEEGHNPFMETTRYAIKPRIDVLDLQRAEQALENQKRVLAFLITKNIWSREIYFILNIFIL